MSQNGLVVVGRTLTIEATCAEPACVMLDAQNYRRAIYVSAAGDLSLRRLNITRGRSTLGYGTAQSGGGIRNEGGSLLLESCAVSDNFAQQGAGGIYSNWACSPCETPSCHTIPAAESSPDRGQILGGRT